MTYTRTMALAIAIALGATGVAYAHAGLKSATPAVNGVVSPTLKEMRFSFSEPIIPAFSGVTVTDRTGHGVLTGRPVADPRNKNVLLVPLKGTLSKGTYRMAWHAVASDTHRVEGRYSFTVK